MLIGSPKINLITGRERKKEIALRSCPLKLVASAKPVAHHSSLHFQKFDAKRILFVKAVVSRDTVSNEKTPSAENRPCLMKRQNGIDPSTKLYKHNKVKKKKKKKV